MRHCSVVPAAASCCPTLHKPSSVLLQVVASSLGDSRGSQRQHLVSRWAFHLLCWILDQPMCYMAWSGLPRQNPDVLWSVAAHSPILAVLSAQLVALPYTSCAARRHMIADLLVPHAGTLDIVVQQ